MFAHLPRLETEEEFHGESLSTYGFTAIANSYRRNSVLEGGEERRTLLVETLTHRRMNGQLSPRWKERRV